MKTAVLVFIDKERTKDRDKVVAMPTVNADVLDGFGQENIDYILELCEESSLGLVAVFTKGFAWKDTTVKEISDGTNWTTADNYFAMAARKAT